MSSIPYREAVGALHYLARGTRFDISLAVSQVARYLHDPGMRHWQAVLRIYRFLHCSRNTPYVIDTASTGMVLEGYTDASWADCLDTSKSTAGWCVTAGGSTLACSSKRQSTYAQSSTESEFISACELSNEMVWWRILWEDLGYDPNTPILWCDNSGAVRLSKHSGKFEATRHFLPKFNILRQRVRDKDVVVLGIRSVFQRADIFTKPLAPGVFRRFAAELLGSPLR